MRTIVNAVLVIVGLVCFILGAINSAWGWALGGAGTAALLLVSFNSLFVYVFSFRRHLQRHMGFEPGLCEVISQKIPTGDRVNLQAALDYLHSDTQNPGPFGVEYNEYAGIGRNRLTALLATDMIPVGIEYEPFPVRFDETLDCVQNALYLLSLDEQPVAVLVVAGRVEVLARNKTIARNFLRYLERVAIERSPYRGQVLSVERYSRKTGDYTVIFHETRGVARSSLILPEAVMTLFDRNLLGTFRQMQAMRRAGRGVRHGVMLYGPPGTGKTLASRYVIGALADVTVILITGRLYPFLRQACLLAERLAPSLVVLEDVDLIAVDRASNRNAPLLHELMDAMDGISAQSQCVFLLTTNRPEVLEPALAARPGRVDQAIFFPLPDRECRRRLFEYYRQGLDLTPSLLERFLDPTEGASPAFIKEWFRRATLIALERGAQGDPVPVRETDLQQALDELTRTGGPLTRRFLGFPEPVADGVAPPLREHLLGEPPAST
jgi:hypothetical protein